MYPTGASSVKFYGLPKIHEKDIPLRCIDSHRDLVTYGVARELTRILKLLVGKSMHHVHNTHEFVEYIKNIKLEEGKCITPYDVTAFYTAVLVEPAIEVIKNKLEQDIPLQRIIIVVDYIIYLIGFCLNRTYFLSEGWFCEPIRGCSHGLTS